MSEALKCPKCNGMNVSLDLGTGLITCHDCPRVNEPVKPKLFDVDAWKENQQEEEEKKINKLKAQDINVKVRDEEKGFNDFSTLGI
jgi:transcription initiation factor TFIIIB Brf1 subunit/transcription initiation factor TFIIB